MTYQSTFTWRQAYADAKRALGVAVVAGVMAGFMAGFMAGPSHATTVLYGNGPGGLFFGPGPFALSTDDHYTILVQTDDATGTAYIGFQSTKKLQTVSTTVMNPQDGGFDFAQVGWFTDKDDLSTGTFQVVPPTGDLFLTTTFAVAGLVKWLVFDWDGIKQVGGNATLNTNLSATATVPLPAGLVLFLSGLIGIGFLGRYKAKRRREEPATA